MRREAVRPFRVPLDAEDGFRPVLNGLNDAVRGGLRHVEPRSYPSQPLMVGAVDQAGAAVQAVQEGIAGTAYGMELIAAVEAVAVCRGKILNQAAAEADVDDLQPPADAEDRFFGLQEAEKKPELQPVQLRVDRPGALIFLTEPGRVDVAAARQKQPVIGRQVRRVKRGIKIGAAERESVFVVGGILRDTGDKDFHSLFRNVF